MPARFLESMLQHDAIRGKAWCRVWLPMNFQLVLWLGLRQKDAVLRCIW